MSVVAEVTPGVMENGLSSDDTTTTTTLFDLIATLQDCIAPDDDDLVTAMVVDLCKQGHLRYTTPRGAGDESPRTV